MNIKQDRPNLEKAEKILIFGGHLIAKDLYQYLKFHHMEKKVIGFAVSAMTNNPSYIEGLPVKQIEEYTGIRKDVLILLAAPEKFFMEIEAHLHKQGYSNIMEVGNFGLAMLENQDAISYLQKNYPWMDAVQDKNEALCVEVKIQQNRMKLMPLAAYPINGKTMECLKSIEQDRWIYEVLDSENDPVYRNNGLPCRCSGSERAKFEVYVVHSPKDFVTVWKNSYQAWERPILGGAVFSDEEIYAPEGELTDGYGDNRGEHISEKNREYAEITAVYWVWKNSDAEYKGISHYRRRYLLDEKVIMEIIEEKYDVVATVPRLVIPNVRIWFSKVSGLSEQDIDLVEEAVCELYPDYKEDMKRFLSGNVLYPNNMIIAATDIYDAYCTWLFSILDFIDTEDVYQKMRKKQRYAAYAAELLTSLFLMHHRKDYYKKSVDYQLLSMDWR